MLLALNVSPAEGTAAFLRARGLEVNGPAPGAVMRHGETGTPPPGWQSPHSG
jgi:hypothetical protein